MRCWLLIFGLIMGLGTARAAEPYAWCEAAINAAEYAERLPPRLLGAIAQVESGRLDERTGAIRPWPWTINAEGEGHYFLTKPDSIMAVRALLSRGVKSIDIGCLQVNLMYHPEAFASLDDAFDPWVNARYAARFLNRLRAAGNAPGDNWAHAIAAYHSETPGLGDAYRVLVMLRWQNPNLGFSGAAQTRYGAFPRNETVYGAFAPASRAYGAFAEPARR